MDYKELITILGFTPKEHTTGIFTKKYPQHNGYYIDVNFDSQSIDYNIIVSDSKTTQNFSQPENFVVLECIDRLLIKGYSPRNIILEKTWSAGHGTSGRLDICVTRDDGTEYLLIECKTYGKEFDKELAKMNKDGGQLFTYFKFSNKADIIMLYASEIHGKEIASKNSIVKIEEDYRTGDVKDFYDKWNKLPKENGVFESWVQPYSFESKALTINELVDIKPQDSSFIFNRFLEILRHNVVSDKPNAFNKIFTLFLCKIYDEKINEETDNELGFQWKEGLDDDTSFQLRLTDLYKEGMWEFLEKKVTDFSEKDFNSKYAPLFSGDTKLTEELRKEIARLRLEKNNEFAIKEVYDEKSFKENAKVVKQVVELLQKYRIRYAKKQQYLSDFFEMLLTTGLKQESGQFFTPVPIAQFIIKSLPIDNIVENKLKEGKRDDLLPYVIDYAAGSGHFITESMHEVQRLLNGKKLDLFKGETKRFIDRAQRFHFDWALRYVYGIEKDYRLVKVGKVGCYLHGDGLANVIHSDGLSNFEHPDYKGKLRETDKDFTKDNKQFDVVVSNPPYSVSAFKNAAREYYKDGDFELYERLTDNSSEIECLFIERTKQLLKDGGVAGVILPSSILSIGGIYTKAREVILQYFEIIAITELGSNTFMATGTNTVVLFLRRRNNYDSINLRKSVDSFFTSLSEVTLNGIESPVSKYVGYVWDTLSTADYITLLKKSPNKTVEESELFKEYKKKIKAKNEKEFWSTLLDIEKDKLHYFILTYSQQVVIVSSGEKDAEKRFLGYEFSNRRGSEGIHPIERGKTIDQCTQLFDAEQFENPDKASTYIYKAFNGDFDSPIAEGMQKNISRTRLADMLNFDRVDFEKSISIAVKKKVKIESKWEIKRLGEVINIEYGDRIVRKNESGGVYPVYGGGGETFKANKYNRKDRFIISRFGMSPECMRFVSGEFFLNDSGMTVSSNNEYCLLNNYLYNYLLCNQNYIYDCGRGVAQKNIDIEAFNAIQMPLPSKEIQEKIVAEITNVDSDLMEAKRIINAKNEQIAIIINNSFEKHHTTLLSDICDSVEYGSSAKSEKVGLVPVVRMGNIQQGKIDWTDLVYTSNQEEIIKYTLRKNDILFNRTNSPELVGKVGIYKDERPAIFAGYLIRVNYKKDLILPTYLVYVLNSSQIREHGFSVMSKSVNQANINGTLLKVYRIPVPPIEEQQKIVAEIERLEVEIARAQQITDNAPAQKAAILKKYL